MRHPIFSALLATGITLCSGCGSSSKPAASPPGAPADADQPVVDQGISRGSINGISYEIHGSHGDRIEAINNNIKIISGSNTIEFKEGRIYLNGKDRGPIKSGDSIVLDANLQLLVNNEKR